MKPQVHPDLEKSRLPLQVAKQLTNAIQEGRFLPGERLSSERQLSQSFGVSRPVLREALSILESQGLIDIQHGRGTFVAQEPAHLLHVAPAQWFKENWRLVQDFYEARLVVEPRCAALAAQNATKEQIALLRQILDRAEAVITSGEVVASIGLDIDFHSTIADMSDNILIARMLKSIINPDTDLRRVLHRLPGRPAVAHRGHERIFAAIESGNSVRSHDEMTSALYGSITDITRYIEGGDADPLSEET